MARGLPDFGVSAAKAALGGMADIGELAARLGGLSRYDRLGDVIFFEDFSDDLGAWEIEKDGTLSAVAISTERFVSGGFSCKLTGGSDGDGYAGIRGRFPVPFSVVYGVELAWTMHADGDYAVFGVDIYTGAYKIRFAIKSDLIGLGNYLLNAAEGWTEILPAGLALFDDHNFINAKFTFNISDQTYGRFLITPRSWDIKGTKGYIWPDLGLPRMEGWGRIYSQAGHNAYTYVDSIILTCNDV